MRNLLIGLATAVVLSGCIPHGRIDKVDTTPYAVEYCYRGVTYVIFPNGNAATGGSAVFTPEGRVVPCKQ